jgi:hypothetical protein
VKSDWLVAWWDCFRVWPNGVTFFLRVGRRSQSDHHPELYFKATQIGELTLPRRSLATARETAPGRAGAMSLPCHTCRSGTAPREAR